MFYPPRANCPGCLSTSLRWSAVSGNATLFTWNVVHQLYHHAFRELAPYVVAAVQLDEGPRLVTNILRHGPDDLQVCMKLQLDYLDVDEELTLLVFFPSQQVVLFSIVGHSLANRN